MSEITFDELTEKIQQHFANQTFSDGLSLASKHLADFPEQYALINYWRICLAARLDEKPLANKILESTLASGIWYSEVLLRQSPSLEPMQGEEEYERLVSIAAQLREVDGLEMPLLVARPEDACHPGEEGCPALIFLHSNMDSAQNSLKHLGYLSLLGWIVVTPQSSQSMFTGAYMWTDYETTKQELDEHYANLTRQYSIDEKQLILGGFSMGAEMALTAALTGDLPAAGFLLLGPGGPKMDNLEEWQPLIDASTGKDLRGVILMGLEDETIPQENIRQLVKTLNQHNIACKLVTFEGLGHEFPPEFEQAFNQAIDFILDR